MGEKTEKAVRYWQRGVVRRRGILVGVSPGPEEREGVGVARANARPRRPAPDPAPAATHSRGRDRDAGRPNNWPYRVLLSLWLAGTALIVFQAEQRFHAGSVSGVMAVVLGGTLVVVAAAMSVGLFFLLGMAAKSLWYLAMPRCDDAAGRGEPAREARPLVALYLTAGDFDEDAVESLLRLKTSGPRLFLLHDDGGDDAARARMERLLREHPDSGGWEIRVWHRPRREGGKAGAVNWVLKRLEPRWELMLLCDSDSIALDEDSLLRCEGEFDDPSVAVVQCRNASYCGPQEPAFQRKLARAIDVFDALAAPQSVWGYVPFMGHNALIRVPDLRDAGGLTPGFFSDDLDLSCRFTLAGKRIVYRRDVAFAERHPADLSSFRKRTRKWACGCVQVVRSRARQVLTRPGIPLAHRVGLLEFMCFYPAMLLLFVGLMLSHLVLPWMTPYPAVPAGVGVAVGTAVALALLSPTLAWSIRSGRIRQWPAFAWSCILVYGGSVIPTIRGVLDGLIPRERPWIPTNLAEKRAAVPRVALAEAGLGMALLGVPWFLAAPALAFPSTYLFVSVFLFSPLTFAAYREAAGATGAAAGSGQEPPEPVPNTITIVPEAIGLNGHTASEQNGQSGARRRRTLTATGAGLAVIAAVIGCAAAVRGQDIQVRGDRIHVDGQDLHVRGIHYSPWLPETGPHMPEAYPDQRVVEEDLSRIADLGANTVIIHSAPGRVIDTAYGKGIYSIYKFSFNWNDVREEAFEQRAEEVLEEIRSLKGHTGIIMWMLGHEVPEWVVDELGRKELAARLNALAQRVREIDPGRLLGHGNWPPTRHLTPLLDEYDVACFNLYPAWPYEVSVRGFGPYLREELVPLAGGRPVLVTEFGVNTLEATEQRQAQIITECWAQIQASPVVGGVVFGWADEWWKNYDNPIPGKGYWEREFAPDDHLTHDEDPEEYYGIVRTDRTPKLAYAAVGEMWGGVEKQSRSIVPWIVVGILALMSWYVLGLARRGRRESEPRTGDGQIAERKTGEAA